MASFTPIQVGDEWNEISFSAGATGNVSTTVTGAAITVTGGTIDSLFSGNVITPVESHRVTVTGGTIGSIWSGQPQIGGYLPSLPINPTPAELRRWRSARVRFFASQ